ncbi:TPA: Rha family transcriptional regulator [Pseudomonas aeruginosa]|uniref:Rha family transcriptional regulator n=8 Tax=Pseudomonas aeruginosa group TaxID=136841 RepID=UPI003458BC5D
MRNPDIKVVKLEGDDLPRALRESGYSACYVVMHGFTPRGGCFLSAEEAERFGKRHDNVLRAIDNLDCSAGFRLLNFEETVMWRENPSGGEPIKSRSFDMTKDGFMFLVMGFRGKAAAAWKEAFIHAFNWMAEQLFKRSMDFNTMRNELMAEYRQERGIASLAGKTLRRWQIRAPVIEQKIIEIEREGQLQLFHA